MSWIQKICARQILDSRGDPTIEVDVLTEKGHLGRASVPSGASKGSFEAVELRDGDMSKYAGKGVEKAISGICNIIAPALIGMDIDNLAQIDQRLIELDGTSNKSKLGANALLAVSLACLKAKACHQPLFEYIGQGKAFGLPVPLINILNGGVHANNGLDVQEFMIVPLISDSFSASLRAGLQVFYNLRDILSQRGLSIAVGDEGGFAPPLKTNKEALDLICLAIEKSKYKLGEDVFVALDVAATELIIPKAINGDIFTDQMKNSQKDLLEEGQKLDCLYRWEGCKISGEELMSIYETWQKIFPLMSIEDAFGEEDWTSWVEGTQRMGRSMQLVGDDLFVTHPGRLKRGIEKKAGNAILIKPNQIGTFTETTQTIALAKSHGYQTIISHRSGETEDSILADLAVGLSCPQIKTGGLCRSERLAKYNQLLRIEEILGSKATYPARNAFPHLS